MSEPNPYEVLRGRLHDLLTEMCGDDFIEVDHQMDELDEIHRELWKLEVCEWRRETDKTETVFRKTSCGKIDCLVSLYKFCPYCGKKIKIV